jgi:hypothetical protein
MKNSNRRIVEPMEDKWAEGQIQLHNIVACRLKACISKSEQTSIDRQRPRQFKAFTRQRVNKQELSTGPYSEPYQSNPHHPILSLYDSF